MKHGAAIKEQYNLPEGAYAALNALQEQARAALLLMEGSTDQAKRDLSTAQAKMISAQPWTSAILKVLTDYNRRSSEDLSIVDIDPEWLYNQFY